MSVKDSALVEALLFLQSAPISLARIATLCKMDTRSTEAAIEELRERYISSASGIEIVEGAAGYILSPKRAVWDNLHDSVKERYYKKSNALSRAALETLGIVANSQPITRGEIERLRGVAADGMIRLLLDRGLIRECGKKDVPGHPMQYGTTKGFLDLFHLKSIKDLPSLEESDIERFELAR